MLLNVVLGHTDIFWVSLPPSTLKDIAEPRHGRIPSEKLRSVFVGNDVSSLLTDKLFIRLMINVGLTNQNTWFKVSRLRR